MVAVITGDITSSRKIKNQDQWLLPLKNFLSTCGENQKDWKIERGDFFQLEIKNPEEALKIALQIKILIKKITPTELHKKMSTLDVRLAIGIGEKTYTGESISESNGTAFIYAGQKFDLLKKENVTIAIKSPWANFDEDMNLYLKLAETFINRWTVSSAELMELIIQQSHITQQEMGEKLGIKQNSVSGRWNRANAHEIVEIEKIYRKKIKPLLK